MSLPSACTSVRCKKCRLHLFSLQEYPLVDCHNRLLIQKTSQISSHIDENGSTSTSCSEEADCETQKDSSMIFLNEESYPSFVEEAVNEAVWQKGKLYCPKCKTRLGSFNFVNPPHCSCQLSLLPAVHLHASKIDHILPSEFVKPSVSKPLSISGTVSGENSYTDSGSSSKFSNDSGSNLSTANFNCANEWQVSEDQMALMQPNEVASKKADAKAKDEKEPEDEEVILEEKFVKEIPDNLICPVCLDLLYSPFVVKPCSHIFCEPCLRRLAQPSPTNTSCPLCRELIGLCNPCHEISKEIKENYPEQHQERHQFEKLHDSQNLPLPWLRDYRFLGFRGRFRHGQYGRHWTGWRTILWIFILDCLGLSLILVIKWILGDYEANLKQIEYQSKQRTLDTTGSLELQSSYPNSQEFLNINNDSVFDSVIE